MKIYKKFKNIISKSDFLKNLLTLLSGTSIAQAIPVLLSPVLTRLYTPKDFGVLAVFISLSSIFGTIANLRYELAVLLPKKKIEALSLVYLGSILSSILSILLLIFFILFHDTVLVWLKDDSLTHWLYFIPLVVFFAGLYNMLNYYNTRIREYKSIAVSKISKSVSMVFIQLVYGFLKLTKTGLILGYGSSIFFGNLKLFKNTIKDKELHKQVSIKTIKEVAGKYKRFPLFTFPATLANQLAVEMTNILISTVFNTVTLGLYSLSNRILGMPSALIGASVGQVYMQEAADEKNRTGKAVIIFKSVLRKLLYIAVPFFGFIFFIAEDLFAFIFGEEWRIAGFYAKIMMPLLFIRFITAPVSVSLSVFEKQHISLIWQVGLLFLSMISISLAFYFKISFEEFLYFYVSILFVYYIVLILILYKTVKGND